MQTNKPEPDATLVERKSGRELVVTRRVNAPARLVYQAWTTPALFKRWWVPQSFGITLLSCEVDARTGGRFASSLPTPPAKDPWPSLAHTSR